MRFKRRLRLEFGLMSIGIAPLIDVVFLLLIFFMLTSSFVSQTGLKINLPKALTSEIIRKESLNILISPENIIYLNGKIVTLKELSSILKDAARENKVLFISADERVSLGRIVKIWDLCRKAGISQINIATVQEAP